MTCGALGAVVVTHDSEATIGRCLDHLAVQTRPADDIVLVDSGSADPTYLVEAAQRLPPIRVVQRGNIGFCAANNLGVQHLGVDCDLYAFINPDTFLPTHWLAEAAGYCEKRPQVGVLSGPLLRYDIERNQETDRYDSLGIERHWTGRWRDRAQGTRVDDIALPFAPWEPQAVCGALMLMPGAVLRELIAMDGYLFDESLFMYKEDIDLSLRVRNHGYRVVMHPGLRAWHVRGWPKDRKVVAKTARLLSASNDIRVAMKHRSAYLPIYIAKYLFVRFGER